MSVVSKDVRGLFSDTIKDFHTRDGRKSVQSMPMCLDCFLLRASIAGIVPGFPDFDIFSGPGARYGECEITFLSIIVVDG